MTRILVVDDMNIFREPIAVALRREGYDTACAANGREALQAVKAQRPDLILLDLAMPVMDGLACLNALRADPQTSGIPVIMLTAMAEREAVAQAAQAGVQGYLLKSKFSLDELRARIDKLLPPDGNRPSHGARRSETDAQSAPATGEAGAAVPSPSRPSHVAERSAAPPTVPTRSTEKPSETGADPGAPPRRLARQETIQRIEEHTGAKTLAGNVAEVMSLASSPRGDAASLATALKRDPVIAARLLQVANSAAYVTNKPRVATVDEAVRNVGFATVRSLAASVGMFEAFPMDAADGFNSIRCWQHSFAVAAIMERNFAPADDIAPGVPHLVGLCHDLAEIVLRQLFADEYNRAIEFAATTNTPLHEVEADVFGMPRHELVTLVLSKLNLPPEITEPIREFVGRSADKTLRLGRLARAVRLSDYYSNGLLLAPTTDALVGPVTVVECRNAFATDDPEPVDGVELRAEVMTLTELMARLSRAEAARLAEPPFALGEAKLWYARHKALATFDPLGAALQFLAQPQVHDRLPNGPDELTDVRGLVVAVPKPGAGGFPIEQLESATRTSSGSHLPVLYLVGRGRDTMPAVPEDLKIDSYPVLLSELAQFVARLSQGAAGPVDQVQPNMSA